MKKYFFILYSLIPCTLLVNCKKAYNPPAIQTDYKYLVVDGVIRAGTDQTSTIQLSRTRKLLDSIPAIPEFNAFVTIETSNGIKYALLPRDSGIYTGDHLSLDETLNYRLNITTANGSIYQSDFVPVKKTGEIDSLTWEQDDEVTVFVNTHDPGSNSRYYRWDYIETWQYQSEYNSAYGVASGFVFVKNPSQQTYNCWNSAFSQNIATGTSIQLSEDVISHAPVGVIPPGSVKLGIRYSTLVRQYGLTPEAYQYWQILQKNTEQTGTLFDPQPSQLAGNIHCITDPDEPVIGYTSACVVNEKRLFIDKNEITNWHIDPSGDNCVIKQISQNPVNILIWDYDDPAYSIYYYISGGGIAIAKVPCLDCRTKGGTNVKPSFW